MSTTTYAGSAAKLYYLSTGTRATWGNTDANGYHAAAAPANLSEIDLVGDVEINITANTDPVKIRKYAGWESNVPTSKKGDITFTILHVPTDTNFQALMKAWIGRSIISFAAMDEDKATSGATGLWADMYITEFSEPQNFDNVIVNRVKAEIGVSDVAPEFVKVG